MAATPMQIFLPKYFTAFLYLLLAWFVLEESVCGMLGFQGFGYVIVKSLPEFLLYVTFLARLAFLVVSGSTLSFRLNKFDLLFFSFFLSVVVSALINGGNVLNALINVRTALRFVVVYYLVQFIPIIYTPNQLKRFFRFLILLGVLQAGLVVVQHVMGDAWRDAIFAAPKGEVELNGLLLLEGDRAKIGAGFGTFGKSAVCAWFLLFVEVQLASLSFFKRRHSFLCWTLYLFVFLGIVFTYKRTVMGLAILAPLLVAIYLSRKKFVILFLVASFLLATPIMYLAAYQGVKHGFIEEKEKKISPIQSLGNFFTEDYWRIFFSKQRGWMLTEVAKQAVFSLRPLGYSADELHAKEELARFGGEFGKLTRFVAFDDVYVVAGLTYYGPLGLGLVIGMFWCVSRQSKRLLRLHMPWPYRTCAVMVCVLIPMTFLSSLVVRILEFRAFSFLLFLFMGLVVRQRRWLSQLQSAPSGVRSGYNRDSGIL